MPEPDAPPPTPSRLSHIPALDGLRGAAVLVVLLFHGGHLDGGYLGVDLFFVLSGYLITSLLLLEGGGTARIRLGRFWERRGRRLLPALGVMLAGVALYSWFAADPVQLHTIRWDGLATIFYVANWRQVFAHVSYWELFTAPSPLQHTWSLAIEEQFYLVWPLVFVGLLAMARRGAPERRAARLATLVLATAVVLGAGSAAWSLWLGFHGRTDRVYYGTDTRAFAILAGVAVAAAMARFGPLRGRLARWALEAVAVVAAAFLIREWIVLRGTLPRLYHGGLVACSLAAAVVIAAAVQPRRGPVAVVASFHPLRWLGLISYGVYLYHWPLFVWLTPERVHLTGWPLFLVRVGVTLAAAVVSYRLVEQPVRHGLGRSPAVRVTAPAVGFLAVTALTLLSTSGYQAPLPSGFSDAALRHAVTTAKVRTGPRVMLVGNSVAWNLARDGFAHASTTPQITLFNDASAGCTYPDSPRIRLAPTGLITSRFSQSCDQAWDHSVAAFRPDYVVFARNGISQSGYEHDGQFLVPCTPAFQSWLEASFTRDAKRLTARGGKLVLVTSPPSLPGLGDLGNRALYVRSVHCGNQAMVAVARANPDRVVLVDLASHLCTPDGTCETHLDGTRLRVDGTHFKGGGARLISDWILRQLGLTVHGP